MRVDLFCQVVDNFGDAGVCWRLARQLAAEFGCDLRLWIDQPAVLNRLCPDVDPAVPAQRHAGVEVRHWRGSPDEFLGADPREVVIEAFGCRLPDDFIAAMAQRQPAPVWINLEYLSAEAWIDGCHGLPSPHPRLPLTKHFFFPGFSDRSGGLPREADLGRRRDAFRQDRVSRQAFLHQLGVDVPQPGELLISLFCYDNERLPQLLAAWETGTQPVLCLVPEGSKPGVIAALGLGAGSPVRRGQLRTRSFPFLDQDAYDRLLWSCDLNFVRGEDSFMRAQWAAMPFVWHIYPQDDAAHRVKLDAFLDRYLAGLEAAPAMAARALFEAWNGDGDAAAAWPAFSAAAPALRAHAVDWERRLAARASLAENLARFCEIALKSRV